MGAAGSCSSSSPISYKKYDVFISFRGEDIRTNFLSHLHSALCQNSIRTYVDYELPRGEDISQSLIQAIKDSTLSLVVFSQNYASSKWCLDELAQILECRKDQGQIVIPIFYKVDPSDVRKQKGTFREAFAKHERDFIHNHQKVNKWKDALFETANLAGWDSRTSRDESELIRNVINDVVQKLYHWHPRALRGLVGIDENCERIELLLEKVPIVGIWGIGGIGKTTMAKVVFAKLSPQYESCCFLENVRENEAKHGLQYMRDKLVSELLKEENILINTMKVLGSTFDMRRLKSKRVFIVLDDVSSSKQLDDLAKECDCLGPGSKVIITTRDKHVLAGRANEIHEAKELNYQGSLKLFSFKAFQKDHPEIGYEQLSERAVIYAKGIPLALIALGLFLHSRTKEEWDSALTKLKKAPNKDIQNVLRLSYDALDDEEKQIFLDIACFLKGGIKECVIGVLNSFGFHATIGIRTLLDKALITMDKNRVWMHDLIQEMGWEIVRQENIKEPGRRSRLCDLKEIYDVLKNNQGTDAVEGIILDVSRIRVVNLTANTFEKMPNIRFLRFYSSWAIGPRNVHIPPDLKSFSNKIRYFEWNGYPLKSLPSNFSAENLVELNMPNSCVQTLWEGVQEVVNLKILSLPKCRQLRELPDLSKAQNLEKVDLHVCESLCYVHPSILSLHTLTFLNVSRCRRLKSLQSETHLRSLRRLDVDGCYNLKEFSLTSEELDSLSLEETGIEVLHPSIGRLNKLESLIFNGSRLKILPIKDLCCLRSLERLIIWEHIMDKPELHMLFDALCSLRQLSFRNCHNLTGLPNNIRQLSTLKKLSLTGCRNLQCLPDLPPSLEVLYVIDCISLSINCSCAKEFFVLSKEIGTLDPALHSCSIGHLVNLKRLRLCGSSLKNLPIITFCCLRSLVDLRLYQCHEILDKPKLHILFDALRFLENLRLEECHNLIELPYNIRHLSRLEHLFVRGCTSLRFVPELPPVIGILDASNCTSLVMVCTSTISRLLQQKRGFTILKVENCVKLNKVSLGAITEDAEFSLKQAVVNNHFTDIRYPGNSVPMWFRHNQTTNGSVTIKLSLASNNLLGFAFCVVAPQFISMEKSDKRSYYLCYFEDGVMIKDPIVAIDLSPDLDSDNVFLFSDPNFSEMVLKEFERRGGNDEGNTYNLEVMFKFKVHGHFIKKCGVIPIYASEYHIFVQQWKLKLKSPAKRKRQEIETVVRRCDDKKETVPPCKKLKFELCTQSKADEDVNELEDLLMRINIS